MHMTLEDFFERGWCRFPRDATLQAWALRTLPAARAAVSLAENAKWLRCGDTWFVGVNALPNGPDGAVTGGIPLTGRAVEFIRESLGMSVAWDRGQVSVVYPGYPRRMESETAAAFRFRRDRDAAHVDGVLRRGARKRRYLQAFHSFIFGIPLVEVRADTSPMVVWERSHELVRRSFQEFFGDVPIERWPEEDVTDLYRSVRRDIFEQCRRVVVSAVPGEAWLVHRMTLHGIAPWTRSPAGRNDARMVVYFRPEMEARRAWLEAP